MRRSILSLWLLVALCAGCAAQITADAGTSTSGASVSSLSFTHTVSPGSDQILVVHTAATDSSYANTNATSVTFSGQSLTKETEAGETGYGDRVQVWFLVAPPGGAGTVGVAFSGTDVVAAAAAGLFYLAK